MSDKPAPSVVPEAAVAAPSATRDEVARTLRPDVWRFRDESPFPPGHPVAEAVVRGSREIADALLARFTITPREPSDA